jgi:hypothetical protein
MKQPRTMETPSGDVIDSFDAPSIAKATRDWPGADHVVATSLDAERRAYFTLYEGPHLGKVVKPSKKNQLLTRSTIQL